MAIIFKISYINVSLLVVYSIVIKVKRYSQGKPIENQFGLTEIFSVGSQEVCDCAMQILKERGEHIVKQEMETGITITGSRFIMLEELQRIAFLPQHDAIR